MASPETTDDDPWMETMKKHRTRRHRRGSRAILAFGKEAVRPQTRLGRTGQVHHKPPAAPDWRLACEDPQWWINGCGDAVRGPKSYRREGWFLLPANLPDTQEFDVGPFKTRQRAMETANDRD